MSVLLSTTYFGPVQWYQKLYRHDRVLIEAHEPFKKQTYRNRCYIATAQGLQALTVPVVHAPAVSGASPAVTASGASPAVTASGAFPAVTASGGFPAGMSPSPSSPDISTVLISDHGNWQHQHWQAITSAYGDSPFLEYYEDDLRPFFFETDRWPRLIDFNEAIRQKMCELLDIQPHVALTTAYATPSSQVCCDGIATPADCRDTIRPKQPLPDDTFTPRPYYQVFSHRHGFLPNLSILDLLLNMGPESIFYLRS